MTLNPNMEETNTHFNTHSRPLEFQKGYHKVWYLKLNDPMTQRALWIRFSILSSANGFKRVAETWAIFFQKFPERGDIKKTAIKQSYKIESLISHSDRLDIKIEDCELTDTRTKGTIQSKGNSIQWDLTFRPNREGTVVLVPQILSKVKLVRSTMVTDCEELLVSGTTTMNGEVVEWKDASGMQGHLEGPKSAHSWVWGHCNLFTDEQGRHSDFSFEGLSAKPFLGPLTSPKLSCFYFHYRGQDYYFNTLKDAFFIKSKNTLNEWMFQVDREDLSFRGRAHAEHKDFAGLTFEDTDGSLLYCANSQLSDLHIFVYRRGKLEASFQAKGAAAFEVVSRNKNPYVPLLV